MNARDIRRRGAVSFQLVLFMRSAMFESRAAMVAAVSEGGGPVEGDHIIGWMLERARKHGLDDAVLALAYTHLKAFEARRAANRLPKG